VHPPCGRHHPGVRPPSEEGHRRAARVGEQVAATHRAADSHYHERLRGAGGGSEIRAWGLGT
jgi:hypothetical protein